MVFHRLILMQRQKTTKLGKGILNVIYSFLGMGFNFNRDIGITRSTLFAPEFSMRGNSEKLCHFQYSYNRKDNTKRMILLCLLRIQILIKLSQLNLF